MNCASWFFTFTNISNWFAENAVILSCKGSRTPTLISGVLQNLFSWSQPVIHSVTFVWKCQILLIVNGFTFRYLYPCPTCMAPFSHLVPYLFGQQNCIGKDYLGKTSASSLIFIEPCFVYWKGEGEWKVWLIHKSCQMKENNCPVAGLKPYF